MYMYIYIYIYIYICMYMKERERISIFLINSSMCFSGYLYTDRKKFDQIVIELDLVGISSKDAKLLY